MGSLLFGMATIASRGLAVPIGLHTAWNFGEWTMGLKGSPGLWKPEGQRSSGASGMVSYGVVAGLGILAFWLWHRRSLKRALVTSAVVVSGL